MLQTFLSWIRPTQVFYESDPASGGSTVEAESIKELEEDEEIQIDHKEDVDDFDYEAKLSELDPDVLDSLIDNEKVDTNKLLDWMKSSNDESTVNDILVDEPKKEPSKIKDDKKIDDDDKGEQKIDSDEKGDQTGKGIKDTTKKVEEKDESKIKSDAEDESKKSLKTFKVTEDYIEKQVQNFKETIKDQDPSTIQARTEIFKDILNGIRGGEMDSRSMRNYVNAQMYIKTIKSPFDADWKPDKKVVSDPKYIEEAATQKNKMITDVMKSKYNDFPDDAFNDESESLKDFEDALTNREYTEYKKLYDSEEARIDKDYDRYINIVNNWEDIAKDTIKTDVKIFESRLAKFKLTLKDIGITSLDLSDKELYNEYLWKNVIFKDGKTDQPNEAVLTFMDDTIPVVKPLGVYQTLMDINMEKIISKREEIARKQGFEKGLNNQEDPSLSDSPTNKDQRDKIEIDENDFDDENLSPEEHQRKLDALKNTILNSSEGKKRSRRNK